MIVVSDTSAISNLLSIGREGILQDLFGDVVVPGVLLAAKKAGLIDRVQPVFEQLVSVVGFRVAEAVKEEFLRFAGER